MLEAMASCVSVTYVDGRLAGDPLDVSMFESTGWVLDETSKNQDQLVLAYVHPAECSFSTSA